MAAAVWKSPIVGRRQFSHIDPRAIDHNIIYCYALNADAFRLSGYMYKPRSGKLTMGPLWDNDRSMGTGSAATTDWRAFNPRTWVASNPLGTGTDNIHHSSVLYQLRSANLTR